MSRYRMIPDVALTHFKKFVAASGINAAYPFPEAEGAYDSKPRQLARDQDQPVKDDIGAALTKLAEYLKGVLPNDAFVKAEIAIGEVMKLSKQRLQDHHVALNEKSSTLTGGGPPKPAMAGDSADSFNKRFPNAARIGNVARYGEPPTVTHPGPQSDSFNKRFPNAARIGVV